MKCNIHNEKYIWFSELHEIENTYYCNKCIDEMIENDMYLTSNNWDYLYEYYINELQLENFKGV
ncbi:MAG: hypothetical protein PPFGHCPK_01266 [Spiroplasma endosymbiont of Drosophila atripex]|nr:MAG: hypothetical protein PPFGHCPK_00323 [Spiroplasma endosymbiont of Drosophila atripex]WDA54796.1 MAG: hypothetical protein PPFGHCPK_01266 [Spiroplasma endosymbiont of Drosophila atripex]